MFGKYTKKKNEGEYPKLLIKVNIQDQDWATAECMILISLNF